MIEFLDPDSSTHLGSALWSEICTKKEALCHSKSYFMSLEKQVGVYIPPLLSVLL